MMQKGPDGAGGSERGRGEGLDPAGFFVTRFVFGRARRTGA